MVTDSAETQELAIEGHRLTTDEYSRLTSDLCYLLFKKGFKVQDTRDIMVFIDRQGFLVYLTYPTWGEGYIAITKMRSDEMKIDWFYSNGNNDYRSFYERVDGSCYRMIVEFYETARGDKI